MGLQLKRTLCSKIFATGPSNLAVRCAKWRMKLNPEKTKLIIFSRSVLARKTKPNLKLCDETPKVYPQVKCLGVTFDSQLNFKKHFEDILDRCNTRYHRLRLLANKKCGPTTPDKILGKMITCQLLSPSPPNQCWNHQEM